MNLVEKAGLIIGIADQLNTVLTHGWREWDKPENTLRNDDNARFNEMLRILQPYAKQINNICSLDKKLKVRKQVQKDNK